MKRLIMLLCAVLVITGCTADTGGANTIYASFYAIKDFTEKIVGDKLEVKLIIPNGQEPHGWEPTPKEMAGFSTAGLILYNGLGMEKSIEKMKYVLTDAKFVEISEGVPVSGGDPHVWLNPLYAKKQMENILNAVVEFDPENKAYYEQNYKTYADKLDKLDGEYWSVVKDAPNRSIVVAHEAYGHLCEAYGLNQIALDGLSAEYEPSPAKIAEIVDFIKANEITYIFFEELASTRAVETVARETGARMLILNPYEVLTKEQIKQGYDYFTVMNENLESLRVALWN